MVARVALACVALAGAVGLFLVASSAFGTATYADCDNLAGECLRMRQQMALKAIGVAGVLGGLGCLWVAASAGVRRARRWHVVAVGLAVAVVAAAAVTEPAHRLDNRYHGWLSDPSGR